MSKIHEEILKIFQSFDLNYLEQIDKSDPTDLITEIKSLLDEKLNRLTPEGQIRLEYKERLINEVKELNKHPMNVSDYRGRTYKY